MDFDSFDHESHMRRAIELAREAADRGDEPFGSVLVKDDRIVMESRNAVNTENDIARHPELTLARRAAAERDDVDELVMYTSTEPCAMCAGGMYNAGLRAVAYSVSAERLADLLGGGNFVVPCPELFAKGTEEVTVMRDVLEEEGLAVHEAYW